MIWWHALLWFLGIGAIGLINNDDPDQMIPVIIVLIAGAVVGFFAFPLFWLWAILAGVAAAFVSAVLWTAVTGG